MLNDIDKLSIEEGFTPGSSLEEQKKCAEVLLRYGYVKRGANSAPKVRAKPGPKPADSRNVSRDSTERHLLSLRILLGIDLRATEGQLLSRISSGIEFFFSKRQSGVFFNSGDVHQIIQAIPLLPETDDHSPCSATYNDCRIAHNQTTGSDISEEDYQKYLETIPFLGKPRLSDVMKPRDHTQDLIKCFEAAERIDFSRLFSMPSNQEGALNREVLSREAGIDALRTR